jgi:hypothetical protein
VADELGPLGDGGERAGLDREVERRREPDGADHPEGVLLEPGPRVADRPEEAGRDVRHAGVRVDERRRRGRAASGRIGAPGHRVDGEVAAGEVELDSVAELDPMWPPEIGVLVVGAEGRELVDIAALADRNGPEAILVDGAGEELDEPVGAGIGGQVPVGRLAAEEDVPERAPDDVTGMARRPQPFEDSEDRVRRPDVRGRNRLRRHGPPPAPVSSDRGRDRSARSRSARPRGTA